MIDATKLATILECFTNDEMSKAQTMQAINRLCANSHAEAQSAERAKDRRNTKQIHFPHDHGNMPWIAADEQRLMSLRAQGYEYETIGRELRRTTRSVRTKFLEVKNLEAKQAQEKLERI
jgi:DNA-binding NarL/FixJ family response regulator